jgi:hypothetical protein
LKKILSVIACAAALWIAPVRAESEADIGRKLVALEHQAMDGWLKGDPDPQLAITDPKITYIHDVIGKRLQGIADVKELYSAYRGKSLFDSYEILRPTVRAIGDVAVLSYQLAQHIGADTRYWNGTQVYAKTADGWRVIHTHWSAAKDRQQ